MSNAENVLVGVTGAVYVGPTSSTAPTASDSTLTGFTDLGYVSADGLTITPDKSTQSINAWQNADKVREIVTESSLTFEFSLLETTQDAVELYFGSDIVSGKVAFNPSNTGGRKSFVFDVVDDTKVIRYYLPAAEVMAVSPITVANSEAHAYGVTVTAYASAGRSADVFFSEFEV